MPLARARCAACSLPLGDPPHVAIVARCVRCGTTAQVNVAADGTPAVLEALFTPAALLAWFTAARATLAQGTLPVAIGVCWRCSSPLAVPADQPMALPCPHCQEPVRGAAAEVLVDQWQEPWCKITGDETDLEFRLEVIDAASGLAAGCPTCGVAVPADAPVPRCARCGSFAWAERPAGRAQLAVRVSGTRGGLPFKTVAPVGQGEMMLRGSASSAGTGEAGKSLLSSFGLSCAVVVALIAVIVVGIVVVVHFVK